MDENEMTTIAAELNKLPKPTSLSSAYLLAQQAFENGFRSMTVNELAVYLSRNLPDELIRAEFIYEEANQSVPLGNPGRNASMFAPAGTYATPSGTLTLSRNFNVIGWNGEDWVKLYEKDFESRFLDWSPGVYTVGQQRNHNGQIWTVNVPNTTQQPGVNNDWIPLIAPLDSLSSSSAMRPLSANQGRALDTKKLDKTSVVDNLNSTSPTSVLSANQGKILNDVIAGFADQIGTGVTGEATPLTVPVSQGFAIYSTDTPGVYINFPDTNGDALVISELEANTTWIQLWGNNGAWKKKVTPIDVDDPVFNENLSD